MSEDGVSSVVGTILMLAVTVTVFGGLAILVLGELRANEPAPRADLVVQQEGTRALLTHRGGESLSLAAVRLLVNVDGFEVEYDQQDFADQFASATWRIGETLCISGPSPPNPARPCLLQERTVLGVAVILGSHLLVDEGERGAYSQCPLDGSPPTVSAWTLSPSDVFSSTVGDVDVTVTVADDCIGLDESAHPVLAYRIDDGSAPPYTTVGTMTPSGVSQWSGTVPAQSWNLLGGQTLGLAVSGMKDLNGRETTTPQTHDEPIDVVTLVKYATGSAATTGSVSAFANAQSGDDAGAEATLTEGASGTSPLTLAANGVNGVRTTSDWAGTGNTVASDDAYATTTQTGSTRRLQVTLADPSVSSGTITSVTLRIEASVQGFSAGDGFQLASCADNTCTTGTATAAAATDVTLSYTPATAPDGTTWDWADLTTLEVRVLTVRSNPTGETWRVDRAWAEVAFTPAYALDVTVDVAGVPDGATETLQVAYRTVDESFDVQVWNGVSYVSRGTLASSSVATFTHALTAAEYNGGAPRVRFVDLAAAGTQGRLHLDYVRVVTQ